MSLAKTKLVKKSRVRRLIQNLFLFLLKNIFPKKNHLYKKKIKKLMNKMRSEPYFFCKVFFLRILYPKFFLLPSKHLYAIHLLLNFNSLSIKYNFKPFLIGGSLLGAVRQETFAGRPTDIDVGILKKDKKKLFNLLIDFNKIFKPYKIRVIKPSQCKRIQLIFHNLLFDVGIYKLSKINGKKCWINDHDENFDYFAYNKSIKNINIIKKNFSKIKKIRKLKKICINKKELENLTKVKLYGRSFFAPSNPQSYLLKKYGNNWKIPLTKQFQWR